MCKNRHSLQKKITYPWILTSIVFLLFLLFICPITYAGRGENMNFEEKEGLGINWKEGEFKINDSIKFNVDGYMYMLLPEIEDRSTIMGDSGSFSANSQEVMGGKDVYLGRQHLYEAFDYSTDKRDKLERAYLRIRPRFHLYTGDILSFHGRADVATGHLNRDNNLPRGWYHQWDFYYAEIKLKNLDAQIGSLEFNDPLDSTFHDPNLLVFSNSGRLDGRDVTSYPEGFEGIFVSKKDLFKNFHLRLGYINTGRQFLGDEINALTAQGVYNFTDSLTLMLYEYVILDKNNVQFPGLEGNNSRSFYTGAYLKQTPKPFGFTANFIYLGGKIRIAPDGEKRSIDREAWLLHLTGDYQLAKETTMGIKFAHSSGDTNPDDDHSKSWWGVNADYCGTNYFFDMGYGDTFNNQLTVIDPWSGRALGINMVGPYLGTSLSFISPHLSKFYWDSGLYYIGASKKSPLNGNRSVGVEFDNIFTYHVVKDKFMLQIEADVIGGGNLYDAPAGVNIGTKETSWKTMLVALYNF